MVGDISQPPAQVTPSVLAVSLGVLAGHISPPPAQMERSMLAAPASIVYAGAPLPARRSYVLASANHARQHANLPVPAQIISGVVSKSILEFIINNVLTGSCFL